MVSIRQLQSRGNPAAALPCGAAAALLVLFVIVAGSWPSAFAGQQQEADGSCEIVATAVFPELLLADEDEAVEGDHPVVLGGLSDLALVISDLTVHKDGEVTLQLLTDRGPTSKKKTVAGKRRVFHNPAFVPTLLRFSLRGYRQSAGRQGSNQLMLAELAQMNLRCPTGAIVTGRPSGLPGDETVYEPTGQKPLPFDANGVDSEGVVVCSDGSFWLTEESLPSILRVTAEGTVVCRYVPQGVSLPAAETEVVCCLPARYTSRQPNRGFEAVAISPDESTLWTMLQSPLVTPNAQGSPAPGVIRLLAFDTQKREPVSEYLYRLGDPTDPLYEQGAAIPEDGKLCAMAALDASTLLVLEQSDDGDAKLYRCEINGATNTLDDDRWFEQLADLVAAGVQPVGKVLVADLAPLLPQFAADITSGQWQPKPGEQVAGLKLEGLAILDREHVMLINDNDFNVDAMDDPDEPLRRSCLWVVSLPVPL